MAINFIDNVDRKNVYTYFNNATDVINNQIFSINNCVTLPKN